MREPLRLLRSFAEAAEGLPLVLEAGLEEGGVLAFLQVFAGEAGELALRVGKEGGGRRAEFVLREEESKEAVLESPALLLRWSEGGLFGASRGVLEEAARRALEAGAEGLSQVLRALKRPFAVGVARDLEELALLLKDPRPLAWGRRFLAAKWRGGTGVVSGHGEGFPITSAVEEGETLRLHLFGREDTWVRVRPRWEGPGGRPSTPLLEAVEGSFAGAPFLPEKDVVLGALFAAPLSEDGGGAFWEEWLGVPLRALKALERGERGEALRALTLARLERV